MTSGERPGPVLYLLTGLPFSGKSTLAKKLAEALQIQVLSYDFDIYQHYKHTVPADISRAKEFDLIQAIAREYLCALLERGESVIYDDLNLEVSDRHKFQKVAYACHANFLLIHVDTPVEVIYQRRHANRITGERTPISEWKMQEDISHFQPPHPEEGVWVKPEYDVSEVLEQMRRKMGSISSSSP